MRKVFLLLTFFVITPLFLFGNILFLAFFSYRGNHNNSSLSFFSRPTGVAYAAIPITLSLYKGEIGKKDGRVEMIRQFLAKYNSPLEPYAENIVIAADTYNLDFRLLPAIAMQESNVCLKIPNNSYNCWGYGIYDGKIMKFANYPEAIETVSKALSKHYKNKGLESPQEIMTKWTPSSNGSWAQGVSYFMDELK